MSLKSDCDHIVKSSIARVLPDAAVKRALEGKDFGNGRLLLVSVGKAAWSMARAATDVLGERLDGGIVVTKHGYSMGPIGGLSVYEAGHPVPDEDSFSATKKVLELTEDLSADDCVIFLLSGGGSALFELPLIEPAELADITNSLLSCGADIVEINTVRKRLSEVKGGRFALHCAPARVFTVVLSDIIGDPLDMIASGPACADMSTCRDAFAVTEKYGIALSETARRCLGTETPKKIENVTTEITGSVRELCRAAYDACESLGYEAQTVSTELSCEARDAGKMLADIALENTGSGKKLAYIAGGETVVRVRGKGRGGRNQELCLAAAKYIEGQKGVCVFSVGSDGTDGPTDAAGGYVDGATAGALAAKGIDIDKALLDNDSYTALAACGGLIFTGATGTNVNDVSVVLIDGAL